MPSKEPRTHPLTRPAKWCAGIGLLLIAVSAWMGSALAFGDTPGANTLRLVVPVGLVLGFLISMLAPYLQHRSYVSQQAKAEPRLGQQTDLARRAQTRFVGSTARWCRRIGLLLFLLNVVIGAALLIWRPSTPRTLVWQVPVGLTFGAFLIAFGGHFDGTHGSAPDRPGRRKRTRG